MAQSLETEGRMKLQNFVCVAVLTASTWVVINVGGFRLLNAEVEAQSTNYQECFFGRQETVDINNAGQVEAPNRNRLIRISAGWTVVSGGGGAVGTGTQFGYILLCR